MVDSDSSETSRLSRCRLSILPGTRTIRAVQPISPTGTAERGDFLTNQLAIDELLSGDRGDGVEMSELHEECGVAAVYHFGAGATSPLCPGGRREACGLLPRMLQDIQNRGQLSAGITTYAPDRNQLLDTHKDLGRVSEVFRMSHQGKYESLMNRYYGHTGIGHVRYATCGRDDKSYAQPFERHHLQKNKWFSFAFNGQLANYGELRDALLACGDHHLTRETDTEIFMHEISRVLSGGKQPSLMDVICSISKKFDGAYSMAMINAHGEMMVARDPLGVKPLCYAMDDALFAAASESVALVNLGFCPEQVHSLEPGHAITIIDDAFEIRPFVDSSSRAHCFFEWIYFANVASTLDARSVYLTRTRLGEELAKLEVESGLVPLDDETIVVPVPDTSKAAADAMAHCLGIPSREGLIRNRYSGRTFIQGSGTRKQAAQNKYTPLREVMEGRRVLLVEDSIVRSTTMRVLLDRIRIEGRAREIHVRVACPPIIGPCFYGIDMSRIEELFAPKFLEEGKLTEQAEQRMAEDLGANSLRYLPVEAIARAIEKPESELCRACITGEYPSAWGRKLYQIALAERHLPSSGLRTYETARI